MNTEKMAALNKIHDAIDDLTDQIIQPILTKEERKIIEKALLKLWDAERSIIRLTNLELATRLKLDVKALNKLIVRMKTTNASIVAFTNVLKSVNNTLRTLATVIKAVSNSDLSK